MYLLHIPDLISNYIFLYFFIQVVFPMTGKITDTILPVLRKTFVVLSSAFARTDTILPVMRKTFVDLSSAPHDRQNGIRSS
jgi:hypothetical protein